MQQLCQHGFILFFFVNVAQNYHREPAPRLTNHRTAVFHQHHQHFLHREEVMADKTFSEPVPPKIQRTIPFIPCQQSAIGTRDVLQMSALKGQSLIPL
jgi:hypothetical protein